MMSKALIDDALYTVDAVAAFLSISRPTLYRNLKDGHISAVKLGNSLRFKGREVRRFINSLDRFQSRGLDAVTSKLRELPSGCTLSHRGQGRYFAFGPDGTKIGGLHMSKADALAALQDGGLI